MQNPSKLLHMKRSFSATKSNVQLVQHVTKTSYGEHSNTGGIKRRVPTCTANWTIFRYSQENAYVIPNNFTLFVFMSFASDVKDCCRCGIDSSVFLHLPS